MPERPELPDALRAALAQVAQAEIPEVLSEARALARARAKAVIEDAMVDELLRAAAASGSSEPETPPARADREAPEPEVPEPPRGDAWWAYCIVADPNAAPSGASGVEQEREVELVQEGELVALVSAVPLSEYSDDRLREHLNDIEWVERVARAHERVLEQTLERATILPLRLCTLYRDQEGVRRMLREQQRLLLDELSELDGRREWGAKVFLDQDRLAATLVEAPEAQAPEGEAAEAGEGHSAGAAYMAALGRARQASDRLEEFGDSVVQEIHRQLEAVADKARANPLQRPELHGRNEQMLLNGAYLVSREHEHELAQVADSLRERWSASGFQLELTGPWPPYNFVSPSGMVAP